QHCPKSPIVPKSIDVLQERSITRNPRIPMIFHLLLAVNHFSIRWLPADPLQIREYAAVYLQFLPMCSSPFRVNRKRQSVSPHLQLNDHYPISIPIVWMYCNFTLE